ncbi:MAG: hypothetical protein IJN27_02915 [Oscillospiraceae bacterium]|nr:hypothetical protein [Oscillospiraceae bacterium]
MGKTRIKRKPTKLEAISLLILMFAVFAVGTKLGLNYVPLMICVAAYSIFIAWRCGYTWKEQEKAINNRIGRAVPVLSIFLGVGALVGSFMFSGTIPMLIYYGIQIISAKWIYLCAFLLCAIFSILTGTANGSVSTAGLATMSIGLAMDGVNLGLLAGAILCGATIGDKLSPLSDTTIMASAVTENDVMDHIKHQAKVVVPAALITLVIYIVIGITTHTDASVINATSQGLLDSMDMIYKWSWILLLPAVVVVMGSVMKWSTTVTLVAASALALAIGVGFQGFAIKDGVTAIYQGFQCKMALGARPDMVLDAISAETLTVLQRGGLTSMSKPFFTIFICFYFAATAELAGTMEVLLDMIAGFVKNTVSLVLSTGVAMVLLECVCGSSTPATAIAGPLFKKKYEDMGLHSLNLAREIEDFGTGSTAFIPWSSSCQLYIGILGLNAMTYLRYSFMNWFIWIIAIVFAITGIGIKKLDKKPEEATE